MTFAELYLYNSLYVLLIVIGFCPASFQHEVIAVSEKVIVRLEDLVKWTVPDFSGWAHCLKAEPLKQSVLRELGNNGRREALHRYRESTLTSGLNFKDVQRERAQLGEHQHKPQPLSQAMGIFLNSSSVYKGYCSVFHFSRAAVCDYVFLFSLHHKSAYIYCALAGLTSVILTGVIHQYVLGIPPDIMN